MRVSTKERIVSGLTYLSLLISIISFLAIVYVYFFYAKDNKFIKTHANNAGLIWLFQFSLSLVRIFAEKPENFFTPTSNPVFLVIGAMLLIIILVLSIAAFSGRLVNLSLPNNRKRSNV